MNAGTTPLLAPEHTKSDEDRSVGRCVKSVALIWIAITAIATLMITIVKSGHAPSVTKLNKFWMFRSKAHIHVDPLSPLDIPMPSSAEIQAYRSKIRTIAYNIDEWNAFVSLHESNLQSLSDLHPLSELVDEFHDELMDQHDVDRTSSNIQFRVDINGDGQCATEYTFSTEAGFMQIECSDPDAVVTGCTSYSPDSGGERFGEGTQSDSPCYTIPQSDGYTRLSARCCTGLTPSTVTDHSSSNEQFCLSQHCDHLVDEVLVGCSSRSHSPMTNRFAGVRANVVRNVCHTQRNDDGYLWVQPYCVSREEISDCYTIEAELPKDVFVEDLGVYESRIGCESGYEMTDCTAFMRQNPATCAYGPADDALWENHGAWIQDEDCVAHGTVQKNVAQAVCCKFT